MWHLCHQVPPSTTKSQRATIKAIKMWLVSATSGNTDVKSTSGRAPPPTSWYPSFLIHAFVRDVSKLVDAFSHLCVACSPNGYGLRI